LRLHLQPVPHRSGPPRDGFLSAFKALLEIIVAAIFLTTFLLQPSRIPSGSMLPTLRVGDFLLLDKQAYARPSFAHLLLPPTRIHRGDLIVFHYPVDPTLLLVKRVIGLPGDLLRLRDGHVLLNGQPLAEPYAFYSDARPNTFRDNFPSLREADPNVDPLWWIQMRRSTQSGDLTVPPNHFFVLGDNRNDSEDSRYWGFVPRDLIVGRPLLVYFTLRDPDDAQGSSFAQLRQALKRGVHSWRIVR
jgi:signal peptidase I